MRQELNTALPQQLTFKVGKVFSLVRLSRAQVKSMQVLGRKEASPTDYCAVEGGVIANFQASFPA